jgi:hypothetical protein
MAFRKSCLEAIGGFDTQFWTAGDDVDICWRLQEWGWTLGFSPAAVVWHHRRNSIRAYWRQQVGYGKAESLLERKWPEKYNRVGHPAWRGRLYERAASLTPPWRRSRIYQGTWGSAPFQSEDVADDGPGWALVAMPEWYLVIAGLAAIALLGVFWTPLLFATPLFAVAAAAPVARACAGSLRAPLESTPNSLLQLKLRFLIAFLHLLHPLARLVGRFKYGLTPWRLNERTGRIRPHRHFVTLWSERWRAPTDWLQCIENALRQRNLRVRRGGEYDRWDLEVAMNVLGTTRVLVVVEEHGAGRQLVRVRAWPSWLSQGLLLSLVFGALAVAAAYARAPVMMIILISVSVVIIRSMAHNNAASMAATLSAIGRVRRAASSNARDDVLLPPNGKARRNGLSLAVGQAPARAIRDDRVRRTA